MSQGIPSDTFGQYYTLALQFPHFYDYLLTLPDGVLFTQYHFMTQAFTVLWIKYTWTGRRTWSESADLLALPVLTESVFHVSLIIHNIRTNNRTLCTITFPHSLPLTLTHNFVNRLLPLMILRLMLSIKKALKVRESGWTSDALSRTHARTITQIGFRDPPDGPEDSGDTASDEVVLSGLNDNQVRGRSGGGTV